MRLPVNHALPLAALVLLAACGGGGDKLSTVPQPLAGGGPAADYPIVLGAPFTIDGTTHTPVDKMNYDAVGYAALGSDGGNAVSIAHKTLPLPSYAEVTSLDSGTTALVRVERRGPMTNDRLVELSPGAAAQLGLAGVERAPIRIRRVNPPEVERALLRRGERAPERMATPPSLLTVLKRRLDPQLATPGPMPTAAGTPAAAVAPRTTARPRAVPIPTATPPVAPAPAATPSPAAAIPAGGLVVQVGAFANSRNAAALAERLGGRTRQVGTLSRVVLGPFASRSEAEAALAKARAAGYSDARILRAD